MTAHERADDIVHRLRAASNPERAEREAAYLKSDRPFIGVDVPTTRKIVKNVICDGAVDSNEAVDAARALWELPEFDARRASVEVLTAVARRGHFGLDALDWLEPMIAAGETWAIVDTLCIGVSGAVLDADRSPATGDRMRAWSTSPDMWVRRASVLSLLPSLRHDLDRWPLFVELADALMGERDFFIRKVIGWVARDVGRRHPDAVIEWATPRLDHMSGVTRREVTRHLRF